MNTIHKTLLLLFPIIFITSCQLDQSRDETSNALTHELQKIAKTGTIHGFSVAIVSDKGTLYQKGFGFADIQHKKTLYDTQHLKSRFYFQGYHRSCLVKGTRIGQTEFRRSN